VESVTAADFFEGRSPETAKQMQRQVTVTENHQLKCREAEGKAEAQDQRA
jgi:hypothetical protein